MKHPAACASQVQALVALQRLPVDVRRVVFAAVQQLVLVDAFPEGLNEVKTSLFVAFPYGHLCNTWWILHKEEEVFSDHGECTLLDFLEKMKHFHTLRCRFFDGFFEDTLGCRYSYCTLTRSGLGWRRDDDDA
jgi:hypothetical protein